MIIDCQNETISNSVSSKQFDTPFLFNASLTGKIKPMIWVGSSLTISGGAAFYITEDGTSDGVAVFSEIIGINAIAINNTSTPTDFIFCCAKTIPLDKKTITINAGMGKVLLALGATIIAAPDSTNIYLTVYGY